MDTHAADAATRLAAKLSVGLGSPGVCYPCLGLVASEVASGGGREAEHRVVETRVVGTLWLEGLGDTVSAAVDRAVELELPHATAARDDLRARGCRSGIFRAVVRRLARELEQETRRALAASRN